MFGLSAFRCRKRANLSPNLFSRFQLEKRPNPRSNSISFSNATSVPGSRHTATFGSPTAVKPRVIELLNCVVTRLSPTFAGRDDDGSPRRQCRLCDHTLVARRERDSIR